jgi:hypothetical protein
MRTMGSYSYYDHIREDEKMFANVTSHFEPLGAEGFNESFASVGKNIQYYTACTPTKTNRFCEKFGSENEEVPP